MNHTKTLSHFNIQELNEMQKATLDAIPKTNDVILISPTGSGKTLAFLLPTLQLLDSQKKDVQVLILVPTRELAQQIEQVFKKMSTGFKISCCYGGYEVRIEKNNLLQPPVVLIGTPGRIAHHINSENISTKEISTLILDEFDKSLDAGFQEEMSFIILQLKNLQKRILTSATPLKDIPAFVGLNNPLELNFTSPNLSQRDGGPQSNPRVQLKSVRAVGIDKLDALMLLIGKLGTRSKIVFCNHRDAVIRISEQLDKLSIEHGVYHGGLEQIDREKVLIKLKNGSLHLVISTDLASRGLDIPEIEAIIHYQLPTTEDVMIHRNGRTARMHASGTIYFMLKETDHLPPFLKVTPEIEPLPEKLVLPNASEWKTLYISAGKKDKINKMDIVGMLLQKGGLQKDELGKIEVLDYSAYAAVKSSKIQRTLQLIREERIKNKKIKFEIST
ncbi:MAG: DEAD/DEAH box helicase [Bacteroidetes bacterium]|nr:DEAD/DEAH box helicase [Bacteroidota bacterium]